MDILNPPKKTRNAISNFLFAIGKFGKMKDNIDEL